MRHSGRVRVSGRSVKNSSKRAMKTTRRAGCRHTGRQRPDRFNITRYFLVDDDIRKRSRKAPRANRLHRVQQTVARCISYIQSKQLFHHPQRKSADIEYGLLARPCPKPSPQRLHSETGKVFFSVRLSGVKHVEHTRMQTPLTTHHLPALPAESRPLSRVSAYIHREMATLLLDAHL
jgi:hypothetical protein